MSAWLVSNDHINVIASYFASEIHGEGLWCELNGKYTYLTPETAIDLSQILLDENVRSLESRYPDHKDMYANAKTYEFEYLPQVKRLYSVGEIANAIDCIEYQSCETNDYYETQGYKLLNNMRKHLLKSLPEYELAEWGIGEVKKGVTA